MIDPASSTSNASEARLELAVAAAAAERANKPRWIVFLGAMLLAVAIIFSLFALRSRAAVIGLVRKERENTQLILERKQALERENANLAARGTAPNLRMGSQIEQLAGLKGVVLAGAITDSTLAAMSSLGLQQHQYIAKAVNQDPKNILEWLVATQETPDLAGLEITLLRLRPGAATAENTPGWNVDVTFSRWEKLK